MVKIRRFREARRKPPFEESTLHAALVASRYDPHARAFFENLLARKKGRPQAPIVVARKLLQATFGIFRSGLRYDGAKLFPRLGV